MRLGLSSLAAPEANLRELLAACEQRGLTALELEATRGVSLEHLAEESLSRPANDAASSTQVDIVGIRTRVEDDDAESAAALSTASGVPLLLEGGNLDERLEEVHRLGRVGVDVRLAVRGDRAVGEAERALREGVRLAWDVAPAETDLTWDLPRLESSLGRGVSHIRLLGGGPESAMQEGLGIGALMGRLGLAGFHGPLILAPGSARYRVAWERWVGRRGGWGCGGTTSDPVSLSAGASPSGGSP